MSVGILLSKRNFEDAVLSRDHGKCVCCGNDDVEVVHLLDARLWEDGGNYVDNGASLCEEHKKLFLMTKISVEKMREMARIQKIVIPDHFYEGQSYDHWGNMLLKTGSRLRGDLISYEDVREYLVEGGVFSELTSLAKYPRTFHFDFSMGKTDDDKVLKDFEYLKNDEVVVTEKMDGENSTLYRDYIHARSLDGKHHPSRSWLKQFWSGLKDDIPENWRVCGENMFAKHSIYYDDLSSYFLGFSVWDDTNTSLSWDQTKEWFDLLGIESVPELYRGKFDLDLIKGLWDETKRDTMEGYVVRSAGRIPYGAFKSRVAKFVRNGHVQTDSHWMTSDVVPNKMRENSNKMNM